MEKTGAEKELRVQMGASNKEETCSSLKTPLKMYIVMCPLTADRIPKYLWKGYAACLSWYLTPPLAKLPFKRKI